MSIRKKLKSLLFNPAPEKEAENEPVHTVQAAPAGGSQEELSFNNLNPALLELPQEHPLYQLYQMSRKTMGQLPAPRICLDEDGTLPPEVVKREKNRLRSVLNKACTMRLKEIRGRRNKPPEKAKDKAKNNEKQEEKPDSKQKKNEPEAVSLDALPCFFLSADKLYAWLFVFPPVGKGKELTRNLLYQALAERGILYGLNTKLLDRLYREQKRYFTLYLVAVGKPAFDGENGNIIDNFPRVIERVLEVDEYDQVDYTALNLIRNVKQDQEICRLIEPTEGEPGRTVLDQEIPAKGGRHVPLPKGRNTEISEDGLSLLASIAGHVEYTGRSFQVKPVLDIPGNVDFSTGSINFLGDVNVAGDVLSGFTVRAMGNIQVGGVVEAGSTVEAGGDLIVVKGILGDGSTVIRVQRSVFSKYIENSTIFVRENLQTDCIINGQVYCDGEVVVRSGRGSIIGGRIWAAKMVSARAVGSPLECRTAIALGGLPCTNFEREMVKRELKELAVEVEKLECQLDSPAKASLLGKLRIRLSTAELKLKQLEDDLLDIKLEMSEKEAEKGSGRLECSVAYPETEISFGDEMIRLRQESRQCIAKLVNGVIVVT